MQSVCKLFIFCAFVCIVSLTYEIIRKGCGASYSAGYQPVGAWKGGEEWEWLIINVSQQDDGQFSHNTHCLRILIFGITIEVA